MAGKESVWSELQRERARRESAAQAQERRYQQTVRQVLHEQERANQEAARAEATERKGLEQIAHQIGAAAAQAMNTQLDARLAELRTLLTSVLDAPPQLSFELLKRTAAVPPFEPGDLGVPLPAPVWEDFAPPRPGVLSGLVGGKARRARVQQAAQDAFARARGSPNGARLAAGGSSKAARIWDAATGQQHSKSPMVAGLWR